MQSTDSKYFDTVIRPLQAEALTLLGAEPTEPTARRIHECAIASYVLAHTNARDYSLAYNVNCFVYRRYTVDALFHPFGHAENPGAEEILAIYTEGQRREDGEQIEEAPLELEALEELHALSLEAPEDEDTLSPAQRAEVLALIIEMRRDEERDLQIAEEMIEEIIAAENALMLELDFRFGGERPGVARLHLVESSPVSRGPRIERMAYCERVGADVKAWTTENGLLWQALRGLKLSTEADLRHAGASALLGFEVSSYRHLTPADLRLVRLGVQARRFSRDWSLRAASLLLAA